MPRILPLFALLLLAGCASNRFAKLTPGTSEEGARAKVGREARRVEHPDYVLHLHPGPKPGGITFLKFKDGHLQNLGTVPAWVLDPGKEPPPRPLNAQEHFAFSARLVDLGLTEEGFALMRRFTTAHPDTSSGATFLGLLYLKGDRPDSAFAVHRAAIAAAKDSKDRGSHQNNLLASYIRTRRYDEGEAYALELLADSAFDRALRHSVHYNLACIYSIQNRRAMAVAELRKAVDLRAEAFTRSFLDGDGDFDNIRTEPGYLEIRARLAPGRKRAGG